MVVARCRLWTLGAVTFPVEICEQDKEKADVHHKHEHQRSRVVARGVKNCRRVDDRNEELDLQINYTISYLPSVHLRPQVFA